MLTGYIAASLVPSVELRTARQLTDEIYSNIFPRN
jgi:hypothetical protein